ncbi:hypothetical protein K470DRAFT_222001 [Piedraia hortae CBS 480.64]|uniref:BZIP transcription factor n=1 Tax=Piedraia hortae CBS 480.64 TaxID=1314780 RepID=A0A6A7BSG5_9PEZI|nr:hypothetical protein K470DRAFT_222001 [Piedraia hortae CBS 480.64]
MANSVEANDPPREASTPPPTSNKEESPWFSSSNEETEQEEAPATTTPLSDAERATFIAQATALQENLRKLIDSIEAVKLEHEKLRGENKFLQSYIGELMSASKITASAGGGKRK